MKDTKKKDEKKSKGEYIVVFMPFREFKRGDRIFDAGEIARILGCHEKLMVNKVSYNDE